VLTPLLLLIVLVLPKIFAAILFGIICAMIAYELLQGTGLVRHTRLVLYSVAMGFAVSIWSHFDMNQAWGMVGLMVYFAAVFAEMMASHVKVSFEKVAICFVAAVILPYLLTSLVRILGVKEGRALIMIPFVIAWLSDSGAYFAGRAFGQRKLAPVISPKKTVEGMVGGILSAMIGMVLYTLLLNLAFGFTVNYFYALVYGLVGSLGGVFGDLCFSVIKRQTGIKDYSKLIPGHGGMLDRFDSMIVVGPLTEALLLLIPVAVK
jgi:phosphatidate cytidylyltransferase